MMNQTSLVGRPLYHLTKSIVGFAEKRGVWSGPLMSNSPELARLWGAPPTSTGMGVNEVTALTYSTVWACVNNISTDVASLPLILYKTLPNGGKQRLTSHKLYRLLHDEPNPEMSSMTFRGLVQAHALTWGNGYAEIVRDGAGRPDALWPITPDRVTVTRDRVTLAIVYDVARSEGGGFDRLPAANMLHLQGLGYDGTVGYNLVAKAREAIGLGLATERFGGTFFGGGATFGGVFRHPGRMTESAIKNFRESVNAQHQGVDRAHKFIVVEENMQYDKLGVDPDHAQFLETRDKQIEEICRYYRMPPHKVQHLIRTSYNSIEHQGIEYYSDTLRPWCVRWEQEITRKLIAPSERMIQKAEHKIEGVLRGDLASRYAAYAVGRQWGWLSANRICELENMDPLPAGGDVFLVPMNMSPADRLNEIIDKQVAPDPAPAPPPASADDAAARAHDIAEAIRKELTAVETRIAETAAKITTLELDNLSLKDSTATLEGDATGLRTELATAQAEAGRLTVLLIEATERTDRLQIEHETLTDDWATKQEAMRLQVDAAHTEAEAVKATAADDAARLQALADERGALAARVEADRQVLQTTAAQAEAAVEKLTADLALAGAMVVETSNTVTTEHAALEGARAELAQLQAVMEQTRQDVARLEAERDAVKVDATTTAAAAEEAHRHASDAAAQLATVTADADAARRLLEEETARLHAERETHTATQATLKAQQDAHAARCQAVLVANRDVVQHTVARLILKETERARKNKGTPARLTAWAESFYLLHEATCLDALRPVMRAHLAFVGSTEDVDAYTRTIIHPPLDLALTQIRTVAAGDVDEFPVAIEKLLTRWEHDRPTTIADVVFQEEMTYVRNL